MKKEFKTPQENFWAGEFGENYIKRNQGAKLLASNLNFFTKALKNIGEISSIIEFGSNIGMNLKALKLLYPDADLRGIEINKTAVKELSTVIDPENIINESILDVQLPKTSNLSLIKGVLIHINPNELQTVYQKLYDSSNKYILIAEYYNPAPVAIPYRGHEDKLFKRDFAGEMLEKFSDLQLIDYGFCYKRDVNFPLDDITWFLLKK